MVIGIIILLACASAAIWINVAMIWAATVGWPAWSAPFVFLGSVLIVALLCVGGVHAGYWIADGRRQRRIRRAEIRERAAREDEFPRARTVRR